MDIWQERVPLRFGDIDRSDRLTLGAAFNYFQEAAISHAEELGVGRDNLARSGQGWMLSRISVVFDRRPQYGEIVTVRSWPRSYDRLFALRDYDIRDDKDVPVVRGRSGWLIIDMEKRRPLRVQQVIEKLPANEGLDALTGVVALESREGLSRSGERKAAYSDIDYYGHVNNTRYIQWIQDIIAGEVLEKANRLRLDINYLHEIKPGEVTELWTVPIAEPPGSGGPVPAGSFAVEGRYGEGGTAVFRAELRTWV